MSGSAQKYPFDRIVIPIKLWAEAYASANVIRELRAAGINLSVEVVASPNYLKGEELGRLRDVFSGFQNVSVESRAEDRPNAFPKSLFISFVDRSSTVLENNVAEMPIEMLKTLFEPVSADKVERLRQELHLNQNQQVLVLGSLSLDEKDVMLRICQQLLSQRLAPRILLVPRDTGDMQTWIQALERAGLSAAIRMRSPNGSVQIIGDPSAALILNMTQGELRAFYALGDLAVIGNSFIGSSHGHNVSEAVALGVPILVGQSVTRNNRLTEMVIREGAGRVVERSNLYQAIHQALEPSALAASKERARSAASTLRDQLIKPALLPLIELLNHDRSDTPSVSIANETPEKLEKVNPEPEHRSKEVVQTTTALVRQPLENFAHLIHEGLWFGPVRFKVWSLPNGHAFAGSISTHLHLIYDLDGPDLEGLNALGSIAFRQYAYTFSPAFGRADEIVALLPTMFDHRVTRLHLEYTTRTSRIAA